MSDTEILDWLENQKTGYGNGVIVRQSSSGRGLRIQETSGNLFPDSLVKPTIREAVEAAAENSNPKYIGEEK